MCDRWFHFIGPRIGPRKFDGIFLGPNLKSAVTHIQILIYSSTIVQTNVLQLQSFHDQYWSQILKITAIHWWDFEYHLQCTMVILITNIAYHLQCIVVILITNIEHHHHILMGYWISPSYIGGDIDQYHQHTATHCNKLLLMRLLFDCNTVQCTATHCITMQCTATHCNALQHAATHCNTLQRTATHYSGWDYALTATHCNALQHTFVINTTTNALDSFHCKCYIPEI